MKKVGFFGIFRATEVNKELFTKVLKHNKGENSLEASLSVLANYHSTIDGPPPNLEHTSIIFNKHCEKI